MSNISPVLKRIIFIGLFLVPFVPFLVSSSFFFPYITTKAFAWRTIVEIVFAAWLLLALLDAEYRPKKSPILYALLCFLAVIGIANIFGADSYQSFWSNFERMEGFITLLHLGAFFVVMGSVFREHHWKNWWNMSLAASALMIFYCLFQLAGVVTISQGGVRVDGTFGNASYLAVYMLIHIFVAALYLFRERKGALARWVYGALILGQLVILYYTATRGAILGFLGGALIIALLNVKNQEEPRVRKGSLALLLALMVVVGDFMLVRNTSFVKESPVLNRFSTISTEELKSGGRSFVWPMALKGIAERPLLGWGQENFSYVFQKHYDPRMYQLEPWFDRAHNIFLDWGIAGGLLGLLMYLSLYVFALYAIWRRDPNFSHLEKSILTGLVAAYFFHNFFVFDHLVSYILFFSLLAYLHTRTGGALLWERIETPAQVRNLVLPAVFLLLIFVLYAVNIKPISTNATLIEALQAVQLNKPQQAAAHFEKAYGKSGFGRPEVLEHAAQNLEAIIGSSLSNAEKNEYLDFLKGAMIEHARVHPATARAQILVGSFFFKIGSPDEALKYLLRAEELSPGKQPIKFEIAEAYLYKGDYQKALETAREAYELDPKYAEAQFTYAVTAIYAGDRQLENQLKNRIYQGDAELESKARLAGDEIDLERWVSSDLIAAAYLKVGRQDEAVSLLKERIENNPTLAQNYISLASVYLEIGNRNAAVQTLRNLKEALPEYSSQVDEYIRQINSGEI